MLIRHSTTGHHRRSASRRLACAVLLATLAAYGCGDDPNDDRPATADRIPVSTADYGTRPTDVGDRRELNRLANLYATLQRRFRAGDMAGACDRVSAHLLDQFPPGRDMAGSCERRLAAYARQLKARGKPAPQLEIDWIRIYDYLGIGGITATDDRGRRLRVPFNSEDGAWKLRLGVFARPDTLNGILAR